MKQVDKKLLEERMLAAEMAIDAALCDEFDLDSCYILADCLTALSNLVLDEDEILPISIEDDATPTAKMLAIYDIAYCCWLNDESAIELPENVIMNHAIRMRINSQHRKNVLKFTQMFLRKYGKLMSAELATIAAYP